MLKYIAAYEISFIIVINLIQRKTMANILKRTNTLKNPDNHKQNNDVT